MPSEERLDFAVAQLVAERRKVMRILEEHGLAGKVEQYGLPHVIRMIVQEFKGSTLNESNKHTTTVGLGDNLR